MSDEVGDPASAQPHSRRTFTDYRQEAADWITTASGDYYPNVIEPANSLYEPVLAKFGQLVDMSTSSVELLRHVSDVKGSMRVQLLRVFRKYVSPSTSVEMLKRKKDIENIIRRFGDEFRPIEQVRSAFHGQPIPDAPLSVLLWEYKDRGKKGYELTDLFFDEFELLFPDLTMTGPRRAGRDVLMREIFPDYPFPRQPVDFVIRDSDDVLAIGLARYDSDRGGAQEDDRTSGYKNTANTILTYCAEHGLKTKVLFLNDGPGLLLGSMWRDYAELEASNPARIMVFTLRMFRARLTLEWLRG